MVVQDRHPSSGVWLTITGPPPPMFFVSVASKALRVYVSGLESTLARISISVDSKWVSLAMNLSFGEAKVRQGGPSSAGEARTSPKRSIQFVTGVSLRKGELLHTDYIPD